MSENEGKQEGGRKIRRYMSRRDELFSFWETELMADNVMLLACAKVCHREEENKLFSLPTWTGQEKCDEAVVSWG